MSLIATSPDLAVEPLKVVKKQTTPSCAAETTQSRKTTSRHLLSKLRTHRPQEESKPDRHVTFAPSPKKLHSVDELQREHRFRPTSERAGEVSALDHQIAQNGGTTSTLELLPSRIKQHKDDHIAPEKRIEELTRENGYLRQELAYYKDTRDALMRFYGSIRHIHDEMQACMHEATTQVAMSEQRLLDYWGAAPLVHGMEEDCLVENYF